MIIFFFLAYQWYPSSVYGGLPPNAVSAGNDADGSPIYIGRSFHEGDQIPVKVLPSKQAAYLSYNGQEILVSNYEVCTFIFDCTCLNDFINFYMFRF